MNPLSSKASQPRMQRLVFLFIGIAILQFVIQVSTLTRGVEFIVTTLTNDDTYYYLQTAWNLKQLGFPTFDGVNATNGVQFLWFWMIALVALVAPTKTALLFAIMTITFLLNALCYLIIWKLGETLQRPTLSLYMASFWFLLSFGSGVYSTGMENSLHALVFWAVIWRATVFLDQVYHDEPPDLMSLTVVLILNAWTRLDGALFSAILYIYCLVTAFSVQVFRGSDRRDIRYVLGMGLLAVSGMVVQLVAFQLMGGSYLPVSTLVKQSWATWEKAMASSAPVGIGAMVLLALIGPQLHRLYDPERKQLAFRGVWYSLLIGVILHLIITAGVDAYRWYLWYLSPSYIFWLITLALIVDCIGCILGQRGAQKLARVVPVSVLTLIFLVSGLLFVVRLPIRNPLYYARYSGALWMSENLPPGIICASWNAGQVGFFSERTVINLDGLINGIDYYNRVAQEDSGSWITYIYENNVDCIADHGRHRIVVPGFSIMQSFPFEDGGGGEFLIWEVLSLEAID